MICQAPIQAGDTNQIIYDEGSDLSGFSVALENGFVKAKVSRPELSLKCCPTPRLQMNLGTTLVSYGESPKALNLYLMHVSDGPRLLNGSSTVSSQTEQPSFGKPKEPPGLQATDFTRAWRTS